MLENIKRVAVIGAGPAGAIAVHALVQEQKFDVIRVFDRRSQIGGIWVYTPHLRPKISSLQDVLEQSADKPVPIPNKFPARTKKTRDVNDHQIRYGDTPMHDHLESNIPAEIMAYVNEPFPKDISPRSQTIWGRESPFRHREVIRRWIGGLFLKYGYEKYLELETTVELAEKVDKKWVLTWHPESLHSFQVAALISLHSYTQAITQVSGSRSLPVETVTPC